MNTEVLIIDDDGAFRFAMRKALKRLGYIVREAASGEEALPLLQGSETPDVALLDLRMKGIGGLEVLRRRESQDTPIIVLTGHGTVDTAVEAMQLGAFSFLEKPVDAEVLAPLLQQAVREQSATKFPAEDENMVGTSPVMQKLREFVARIGPTDETVCIVGETGTGKEVLAGEIHRTSRRAKAPFVAMNAACVPRDLFESELFGHKRGAFTGATADHQGLFQQADGGTLFIDELGELPLDLQAKLLRVLETQQVRAVGATKAVRVDVRIVAATNRPLWEEVKAGRFREDLYFRLQVFPIVIPPLRERKQDIPALVGHLLGRVGRSELQLDAEALESLQEHEWPGNIRELLNVLRRASIFAHGDKISGELARRMIRASVFGQSERLRGPQPTSEAVARTLADVELDHIRAVLDQEDGNITKAAQVLGIDRRTLQRKMRSLGIS